MVEASPDDAFASHARFFRWFLSPDDGRLSGKRSRKVLRDAPRCPVPRHAFLSFPLFNAPAPRHPNPFLTVSVADVSFVGANETRCERGLKLSPYVHPPRLSLASSFFPPVLPFGRSCQPCRGFGIGPRRLVGSLSRCPSSPCFFLVTRVASRNYVKYLAVSRSFSLFFSWSVLFRDRKICHNIE